MTSETSDKRVLIAAYGRSIATTLEQQGIDPQDIFDRAGVTLSTTTDPLQRMSNTEVSRLFHESVKATGNQAIGLQVGESMHISNLHALGFALLASSTLRDFCLRLDNYYRLASKNVEIKIIESPDITVIAAKTLNPGICWETEDAFVAFLVRMIRIIYEPNFRPNGIELIRPKPACGCGPYKEYFMCDVSFDNPNICIGLDAAVLDKELPGSSKELAQMHDKTMMDYLAKIERQDTPNRVRSIIVEGLSAGTVNKQSVADKLFMSTRNLELKLAEENTNFQRIFDDTRQKLASGYIEQSTIAITEIAYLLGFSDAANFTRAFKRWTGKSPLDFRKSLGLDR